MTNPIEIPNDFLVPCWSLPENSDNNEIQHSVCQSHSERGKSVFLCNAAHQATIQERKTKGVEINNIGLGVRVHEDIKHLTKKLKKNSLTNNWTGIYGGTPDFDHLCTKDVKLALEEAIRHKIIEIDAIAKNPEPPSFSNVIEALENSGRMLSNVMPYYVVLSRNMSSDDFQIVEAEMETKLVTLNDLMMQNKRLFKRLEALCLSSEMGKLTPEQQRVTQNYYNQFVRAGAKVNSETKIQIRKINTKLAVLMTQFNQNLLADENTFIELHEADLVNLPEFLRAAAKLNAQQHGMSGSFIVTNTRSSVELFLQFCPNRALRKKIWKAFIRRGDNGNKTDNKTIISKIIHLRARRAELIGYPTFAHWSLDNTMAKTPEQVQEILGAVWKPAVTAVKKDLVAMQEIVNAENGGFKIEPWDYRYYAEKLRKKKYDLDMNEVKPYFQFEKLQQGMFWTAKQLFGFTFKKSQNVSVFHKKVTVWEVNRKGQFVGLLYVDPFARTGKRSGAWMTNFRLQKKLSSPQTAIVSINTNFIEGELGQPTLLSLDDAETLFHEFGHALHGLASNVTYPSVSGIEVPQDYIEFPSRLMERWLMTPKVIQQFMLHHQTGKPIPPQLILKLQKAAAFNQGFTTLEYLVCALIDMKLHMTSSDKKINPAQFERKELATLGMPTEIVMRHRIPQFTHLFSSEHYAARYYSYLWSDILTSDAWRAFLEAGDPYDKKTATRFYDSILSRGNSVDPSEQYEAFLGRKPKIDALMRDRGFLISQDKAHQH